MYFSWFDTTELLMLRLICLRWRVEPQSYPLDIDPAVYEPSCVAICHSKLHEPQRVALYLRAVALS
jgi:hypothetical protein